MGNFVKVFSIYFIFLILFMCPFNFIGSVPIEPACSKFSYDEQLLEKMVRMEFSVENMKKDVEKSVSNVENIMLDIKGNNSELSVKFSEQQKKINNLELQAGVFADTMANKNIVSENTKSLMSMKAIVKNIKREQEESTASVDDLRVYTDELNTTCEDGLADLSKKNLELEKQIKVLSIATKKIQTVAFNVMDAVSFTGTDAIKFSTVVLNKGDAYNRDTGIFTAPIDGIYQFNAHICGKQETVVDYVIKVERTSILTGEFRASGGSGTKCTSFGAVALVRKDENVRVGGMDFSNLDRAGNDLSSFSGTLIQSL